MKVCPHCSSTEIDKDPQQGATICMGCGSVLEDQIIVSEIQFVENAGGGASVVGQHVSADGGINIPINGLLHAGFGRQSQEITLQRGKRKIQHLASQLRMNQHCIDMAYNIFRMAVRRGLTRGRRTTHVTAACLYIVCRDQNTPHMLLDFSDVLRVNVYALGKTYLQLARHLCINVRGIDPCLLIHRFAHMLEFGDKEHEVSMTALRLVQRMQRDWMDTGRRPSGLCGAALLVAARIHNFSRTVKDVVGVVKVCGNTVKKRLLEFEETPSSQLTVDEFQRIDLEEAADPPAFTSSRRRAKEAQASETAELDDDEDEEEDAAQSTVADGCQSLDIGAYSSEINTLSETIDKAVETRACRMSKKLEEEARGMLAGGGGSSDYCGSLRDTVGDEEEASQAMAFVEHVLEESIEEAGESRATALAASRALAAGGRLLAWPAAGGSGAGGGGSATADVYGPRPTAASLGIVPSVPKETATAATAEEPGAAGEESGELDLTGINDDEINQFIMNKEEVRKKTALWMELNADYLKEQEEKRQREAEEEEQLLQQQQLGQSKPDVVKKKRRSKRTRAPIQASTAGEAIEKIVMERRMSSKINYEVLKDLGMTVDNRVKAATTTTAVGTPAADVTAGVSFKRPAEPKAGLVHTVASKKAKKEEVPLAVLPSQQPPAPKISTSLEVVVETGPVAYSSVQPATAYDEQEEADDDDGEYDDEGPVSAVHLFGRGAEADYDADDYGDEYND